MAQREDFYFWNIARREILHEALRRHTDLDKKKILDIGCGTGGNLKLLNGFGDVFGLDVSDEALRFARTKGFSSLLQGTAERLPFADGMFDLATALDVFEHVREDELAMREAYRVLRPGGTLCVTVPAFALLWSQHDIVLHHFRRYTKREMSEKLRKAGFVLCEGSYFVMLGFIANGLRKLQDRIFRRRSSEPRLYTVVFSPVPNALLLWLMRIEKMILRVIPLPFGTSLLVIARKPNA